MGIDENLTEADLRQFEETGFLKMSDGSVLQVFRSAGSSGHFYQLTRPDGSAASQKDTLILARHLLSLKIRPRVAPGIEEITKPMA